MADRTGPSGPDGFPPLPGTPSPLHRDRIRANGVRLHVVRSPSSAEPPLVLLHGFPEFWYGWRHQISYFSERGYDLWIPDQRGYNRSEKPDSVRAYRVAALARDILQLVDHSKSQRVDLVGHDWGAVICWWLATYHPRRVRRMVVLNVPHPHVIERFWITHPKQLLKSWYILAFQFRGIAEKLLRAGDHALLLRALRATSRPGAFQPEELSHYRRAWSQPGALTGMLNWYRALLRHPRARSRGVSEGPTVTVPTRILWGVEDVALLPELARRSADLCRHCELTYFEDTSHWIQHERAPAVNDAIHRFLRDR